MPANRCNGTTKTGQPCGSFAGPSGYCVAHDPVRREQNAATRRKGGEARSNLARARRELLTFGAATPEEVLATLVVAMRRVGSGQYEPAVGSSIASLARAWFSGRQLLAVEELERRVSELERVSQ